MTTATYVRERGWLPYHVRLEQLLPTSPVQVRWIFPVHHECFTHALEIDKLVTFTRWS